MRCPTTALWNWRAEFSGALIMRNKETWKIIIQTVISILSAIATTLGLNSCL